jgi:hypothetical protein
MQIYSVSITEKPKSGELVLVEAGFAVLRSRISGGGRQLACGQRHYIGVLIHKFVVVTS